MVDDFSLAKYCVEYDGKTMNLEQELKNTQIPLVLYFSAKWCGPCKMMFPALEEKLEDHKNFKVIKIEADKYEDIANEYDVTVLPTIFIYHKCAKIDLFMGSKDGIIDRVYEKISTLKQ